MAKLKVPDLAIDLGTSRTRIASRSEGVFADVPTAIALRGNELVATGEAALELRTSAARGISVVSPVRNGVVTEFAAVERLLTELLRPQRGRLRGPRALVSFGAESTEVERRATIDCVRAAGVREVIPVDRMIAAALGAGLAIQDPTGNLLLDAGGGGTRIAILCMGRTIAQGACAAGGEAATEAIRRWLTQVHDVVLAPSDVQDLKHRLSGASSRSDEVRVRGLSRSGASVREATFQVAAALAVIDEATRPVAELARSLLRDATPELSADIFHRGCVLTGAGSQLAGLDAALRRATNLATIPIDTPGLAVIRGGVHLVQDTTNATWAGIRPLA